MAEQILRDRRGIILGRRATQATGVQVARDAREIIVGRYDPQSNITRDARGLQIGQGNLLSSLITSLHSLLVHIEADQ